MPVQQITITHKTLYTFPEMLAQEGQGVITSRAVDKAREWLAEAATDDSYWHECLFEQWKEALTQIGFLDPDLAFSGFSCQGDGASFTARVDVEEVLKFICAPLAPKDCIAPFPEKPDTEDFRPWLLHEMQEQGPYCGDTTARRFRRLIPLAGDSLFAKVYRCGTNYVHEETCAVDLEFSDSHSYHQHPRLEKLADELKECLENLRRDLSHALYKSLEEEYDYCRSDEHLKEMAEANEYTFDRHGNRD